MSHSAEKRNSLTGFDNVIQVLRLNGAGCRAIQRHLTKVYGVEVSHMTVWRYLNETR